MMALTDRTATTTNVPDGATFFDIADDQVRTVQLPGYDRSGAEVPWTYRVRSVMVTRTGVVWVSLARIKADGTDYRRGGFASVQIEKLTTLNPEAGAELAVALMAEAGR